MRNRYRLQITKKSGWISRSVISITRCMPHRIAFGKGEECYVDFTHVMWYPEEDESAEAFATLHRVCKGFIDLLFVRGEGDNKRYSILDWKSDLLDDYSPKSVKEKVDEEYSVQRVLYSYCLIKWLKNFEFCKGMSEQDIFDKHFGGIYYAFLRGTDGKTDKGIYAQTWKDYDALKSAYERVKDLMKQEKK